MTFGKRASSSANVTLKGLSRRDKFLDTATDLFLEQGYDAVSIDEIVRVIGGSKTSLYKNFGGKEGLLNESVQHMCDRFLSGFGDLDVSSLSPADGLRVLGGTLLKTLMEERHIAFQRLVIAISGRFPELAHVWFESGPQRSRSTIANFIAAKQKAGMMKPADPQVLAIQYHDMIVTNLLYRALIGDLPTRQDIARSVDDAIETLLSR